MEKQKYLAAGGTGIANIKEVNNQAIIKKCMATAISLKNRLHKGLFVKPASCKIISLLLHCSSYGIAASAKGDFIKN